MEPQIPSLGWMRTAPSLSSTELLSGFSDVESENSELTINNLAVSAGFISGNDSDGWTYTPADDFNGEVTISYAVSDPDGGTTLAAYSFNVAAINDAPELSSRDSPPSPTGRTSRMDVASSQKPNHGFSDRDGDNLLLRQVSPIIPCWQPSLVMQSTTPSRPTPTTTAPLSDL